VEDWVSFLHSTSIDHCPPSTFFFFFLSCFAGHH
jgi:hypothetical protein